MNPARRPVVVVLGQPDTSLISSLRTVGLAPIARDGDVVVWGAPPTSSPDPAPSVASPPGVASNLLITIRDAAATLGLGRSTVYELIGQGRLEVVHVGRSARVPAEAVRAFVERLRRDEGLNGPWRAVG
jgi:excisionase family DNA binding protein